MMMQMQISIAEMEVLMIVQILKIAIKRFGIRK